MRLWWTIALLAGALPAVPPRPPAEGVVITHYGGPDFVIRDGSAVIYVDPLPPNAPNFVRHFRAFRKTNHPPPDLVVITHQHNDHCSAPAIEALARLNPRLKVIAPVDTHDALDRILSPDQLMTPVPKPGQPAVIRHGAVTVRAYRTLHGWLTDDLTPYNLTFPFHHTYVLEIGGRRILVSGDSYDYQEAARDYAQLDAVLWHIYKPSDLFDLQALQARFAPVAIVPYHLNIRYGLQQPEMAGLTARYRFPDANIVYLTEGRDSVVLPPRPTASPQQRPAGRAPGGLELTLEIDRLFRGIQPSHSVQLLARVHNRDAGAAGGELSLDAPQGWQVQALDPVSFPRLEGGHDFLCRFRVRAPDTAALDPTAEYPMRGRVAVSGGPGRNALAAGLLVGGGQIYAWNILGPFHNADGLGDRRVYPPEETLDLKGQYSGRYNAPLRWMPHVSRDLHAGYIDLAGRFDLRETYAPKPNAANPDYARTQEQLVAYAVSFLESPQDREVMFHAGAPYGLQLFLNGARILQMPGYSFNFHPGQQKVAARLRKGRNTILVKIARGKLEELNLSPWLGFCLRVLDTNGRTVPGLQYSME